MSNPERVVLYLRLSSVGEDSTSIARQEADLRALAEREGWPVARVLTDDGISGRKSRANAEEALRMLRDGEAEVLAVWALDRFTRQGIGAVGRLVETLDAAPAARFVTLRDGLDSSSPTWRLIASVLSEVARTEAENTAARQRSAIAYRKTVTGRFTGGGTIPYGYASAPAPDGVGRVLVVDRSEAAVVREVADRILDGETLTAIARDLNDRGVPTSKSAYRRARYRGTVDETLDRGRWRVSTMVSLWTSHTLAGRTSLGSDVVRDGDGLPVTVWEPVLDAATLERLRARLKPSAPAPRRRRAARLLSGVAFCAYCDRRLYVTTSGGRAVYACPASWNGEDCPSPKIDALHLEALVEERFLSAFGSSPEVEVREIVTAPETTAALADVEAALREALGALAADDADTGAIMARVALLKDRRAALRATPTSVETIVVATGRTLADAWHASTSPDDRRTRLVQTLDHVAIQSGRPVHPIEPSRVLFRWHS